MTTNTDRTPKKISLKEALVIAQRHERRKEFDQARALYAQILRGFPDTRQARARLAALAPANPLAGEHERSVATLRALFNERRFTELETQAKAALTAFPQSFAVLTMLGAAQFELGKFDAAEESARAAFAVNPGNGAACFNVANALRMRDKADAALSLYEQAVQLDPKLAVAHSHLAMLHLKSGDTERARAHWDAALAIEGASKDAYLGLGLCHAQAGEYDAALQCYSRALEIDPDFADAHNNIGNVLFAQGKLEKALGAFNRALELNPALDNAYSYKFWLHRQWCDFTMQAQLEVRDTLSIFDALSVEDDPQRQQMRAAMEWKKIAGSIEPLPLPVLTRPRHPKIRIGYFSADFHNHATMQLMAGVLREHDRTRFEVHAFSYGSQKNGEMRDELQNGNLIFHDVEPLSDRQIVEVAREADIDIALDLKGHTAETRSQIFGYRLAPVQMNYLAFPCTMGSDAFDYIIADRWLIPDTFRGFYSEHVLYMPDSYQPNDNLRPIEQRRSTRTDHGLPEKGFVFCCFNAPHKISVGEYEIWMRLLAKVENSVLWLLCEEEITMHNLRHEAAIRGIAPERIVFSGKVAHPLHLERHRHADLFLDTFNYNAHTTTTDALWAGLPVVTKVGKQFSARVAASLLSAIECADLITETPEDYEAKILDLAKNAQSLRKVRERIVEKRGSAPLFNTRRYTRNLETGFELVFERYQNGLPPADIVVQQSIAAL